MSNKYYCPDCGHEVDVSDLPVVRENLGEFWGAPAYKEGLDMSCSCGGEFIEDEDRTSPLFDALADSLRTQVKMWKGEK